MDSGPVATFQVHEYLRPKVRFYAKSASAFQACKGLIPVPYQSTSYVICMRTTQSSTNSSAVSVEMDFGWPPVLTGLLHKLSLAPDLCLIY